MRRDDRQFPRFIIGDAVWVGETAYGEDFRDCLGVVTYAWRSNTSSRWVYEVRIEEDDTYLRGCLFYFFAPEITHAA